MKILRLNVQTFPMNAEERAVFAPLQPEIVETETEIVPDVDAVMVVSAALPASAIAQLKRCRIISRLGTGVDKIDVAAATRAGIVVTNLPDFCTEEVADHTLALLLAAARQLPAYDREMRRGQRVITRSLHRLAGQTLGIIGYGRIGRAVAQRAQAFGLNILAHDPAYPASVTLDELLGRSDYVCLLCPLTEQTRGMFGREQFQKMKRSAVFINTGRGEVVVEPELVEALRTAVIRFAALDVHDGIDVFTADGFATSHPLFGLENVLLTPHVAAVSEEAARDARVRGAQAVVDVLSGRQPKHPVNPAACK